jgi:hypothetical protein
MNQSRCRQDIDGLKQLFLLRGEFFYGFSEGGWVHQWNVWLLALKKLGNAQDVDINLRFQANVRPIRHVDTAAMTTPPLNSANLAQDAQR